MNGPLSESSQGEPTQGEPSQAEPSQGESARWRRGRDVYASQFSSDPNEVESEFVSRFGRAFTQEAFEASGGSVWHDGPLSRRETGLVVIGILATLGGVDSRLRGHVRWALDNGATADDIESVILVVSNYAGYPRSSVAMEVVRAAIAEKNSGV